MLSFRERHNPVFLVAWKTPGYSLDNQVGIPTPTAFASRVGYGNATYEADVMKIY